MRQAAGDSLPMLNVLRALIQGLGKSEKFSHRLTSSRPLLPLIVSKNTLVCCLRFAAASHFARRGKSAAAAAITLTTQREMCM